MKRIWSKRFGTLLTLLLVLGLCGCGGGGSQSSATPGANGLEQSSITLASARDPQLATVIICGIEEGFFADEGLEVNLELFASGGDLTAAIASGDVPLGSAGDTPATILMASDAGKYKFIARQSDISGAQAMVVNPDVIATPSDLNGKRIGYVSGNSSEALWLRVVEEYDLDTSTMEIYRMGATELVTAFDRGELDAYVCWEPTILNGTKVGGMRFLSASKTYFNGVETDSKLMGAYAVLVGDASYIEQNPLTVQAVLRAMKASTDWIAANPDAAAAHVAGTLSLEVEDVQEMMRFNAYELTIDDEMLEDMASTAQFLLEAGKISAVPDFRELADTQPLASVDASLVNLE